jgi:uncharacterized protein involved in exopolysaccharide biosynthesis
VYCDLPHFCDQDFEIEGGVSLQAGWRYLAVAWRWKWIVIPLVVIPAVAAYVLSHRQESRYQATASVLVSQQNLAAALTNLPDQSSDSGDAIRRIQTQASVARSIHVANIVVKNDPDAGISPDGLLGSSSVEAERDADVLLFHVQDHDPGRAIRLVNGYAKAFTVYRRQLDTRAVQTALRGVQDRLGELQGDSTRSGLRDSLEAKKEQLDTLAALQTANATVDNPARGAVKVAPKTKRNVVLGLFVGLVLAALVAFALETRPRRSDRAAPQAAPTAEETRTEQLV